MSLQKKRDQDKFEIIRKDIHGAEILRIKSLHNSFLKKFIQALINFVE